MSATELLKDHPLAAIRMWPSKLSDGNASGQKDGHQECGSREAAS